jgi:hypothetical protein
MTNYLLKVLGVFLFSFIFSSSYAQTQLKERTEEDVKKLLCNNWHIIAQETQGKKTIMPAGEKAYMNFKKDGILIMGNPGNAAENCRWSYEHKASKIKFLLMGEEDFFTIVSISPTGLILLHTSEGYPIKVFLKRAV